MTEKARDMFIGFLIAAAVIAILLGLLMLLPSRAADRTGVNFYVQNTEPTVIDVGTFWYNAASSPPTFNVVLSMNPTVWQPLTLGSSNGAPTINSCGGGTPSIIGTDSSWSILTGTGVLTSCSINWSSVRPRVPYCVVSGSPVLAMGEATTTAGITMSTLTTMAGQTIVGACAP